MSPGGTTTKFLAPIQLLERVLRKAIFLATSKGTCIRHRQLMLLTCHTVHLKMKMKKTSAPIVLVAEALSTIHGLGLLMTNLLPEHHLVHENPSQLRVLKKEARCLALKIAGKIRAIFDVLEKSRSPRS
jgi:hypothetical protein